MDQEPLNPTPTSDIDQLMTLHGKRIKKDNLRLADDPNKSILSLTQRIEKLEKHIYKLVTILPLFVRKQIQKQIQNLSQLIDKS